MILPPRLLTKKERKELEERIQSLGREGLVKVFLHNGWSQETAELLADAIWQSSNKTGEKNE